jgi:tRNA (guanine-N7-)-methyltransferase
VSTGTLAPPAILTLADLDRIGFQGLFAEKNPLELEVGMGRGDFLLSHAAAKPSCNFIGVERKLVIARRAGNKLAAAKLGNVRILQVEISHFLEACVPPGALRAVHIYFPDPWPKKRHAKRRFFTPANMELLRRALAPGALVHVRTDHRDYFAEMSLVLGRCPFLEPVPVPDELLCHQTAFERRFLKHGMPIHRASYRVGKSVD